MKGKKLLRNLCKSCICMNYLELGQLLKLIAVSLIFFFSKKYLSPQKMFMPSLCLRRGAYLNRISCVFACLFIIFLGNDDFVFSKINENALGPLRNDISAQITQLSCK